MFKTLSKWDFQDAFNDMRPNSFSNEALDLLYDYFEDYDSSSGGEETELDVIAIDCEFCEQDIDDIISDYDINVSDCETDIERAEVVLDYLHQHTSVVGETSGTIVYMQF